MDRRKKSARRAFHIPLDARNLPRERKPFIILNRKIAVQNIGSVNIRISVHDAVTQKLRVFQRGDQRKHPLLFGEFQVCLTADEVVGRARRVLLPKLQHRVRPFSVPVRKPHGLERAETEGIPPARGHDFDGHTPLEDIPPFKLPQRRALGGQEVIHKLVVFLFRQRTVDVVARALAVPVARKRRRHVYAVRRHDGRGGVVKIQSAARFFRDIRGQRVRRQRPRRHDRIDVLRGRGQLFYLRANNGKIGTIFQLFRNIGGKTFPIDGQRRPRGHGGCVRGLRDERTQQPHLLFQQAAGVRIDVVALQRIGTDQLAEVFFRMRGRKFFRLHIDQLGGDTLPREIIRGLAARKPAADHAHPRRKGIIRHRRSPRADIRPRQTRYTRVRPSRAARRLRSRRLRSRRPPQSRPPFFPRPFLPFRASPP